MLDIGVVSRTLEKAQVVIADGHHRWQTALHYRNERRAAEGLGPWDLQLMFLVDASRWGPSLLPIHRVVSGIDATSAMEAMALGRRYRVVLAPSSSFQLSLAP